MKAREKDSQDLYAVKLDQILAQLDSMQNLLLRSHIEQLEGGEGFEGAEADAPTGLELFEAAALGRDAQPFLLAPARSLETDLENFIDGLGLAHFRGSEFTPYWTRVRNGVRNSPPPRALWGNIVKTLVVLDRFRSDLGSPVHLTSTYRSTAYNNAVGGAGESQHSHFRAIDFTCGAGNPRQWATMLRGYRGTSFNDPNTGDDFTFRGGIGVYSSRNFVHIDTRGHDADW